MMARVLRFNTMQDLHAFLGRKKDRPPTPHELQAREDQEQMALLEWCGRMEKQIPQLRWLFHVPNGELRHIVTAKKLIKLGVKRGVPDLFLPVRRWGFAGLFIEMKSKQGSPTPEQEAWRQQLEENGYRAVVCYGWDEAREMLLSYLGVKG